MRDGEAEGRADQDADEPCHNAPPSPEDGRRSATWGAEVLPLGSRSAICTGLVPLDHKSL